MPKGVVFSLSIVVSELASGGVEVATQRGGTVYTATGATWEEAYFALKAKMAKG